MNCYGHHLLHLASAAGDLKVAQTLIDKGADVNAQLDVDDVEKKNKTPLHLAVNHSHLEVCQLLIQNEAKIDALDAKQNLPLHLAKKKEIIELLIAKGSDLNLENADGNTPMKLAFQRGFGDFILKVIKDTPNAAKVTSMDQDQDCLVCFDTKMGNFYLMPCGHSGLCETCCIKIVFQSPEKDRKCPLCRIALTNYHKV